jgi:hypothetical protein
MQKIGMIKEGEFNHPDIATDNIFSGGPCLTRKTDDSKQRNIGNLYLLFLWIKSR